MGSSPRFTRGTSVIAALVLAAVIGAVALGIHAIESNSTNTNALSAQTLQPLQPITYANSSANTSGSGSQSTSANSPTCAQVLMTAVTNHTPTPVRPATIPDVAGKTVDDSCNAAVQIGTDKAGNVDYNNGTTPPPGSQTKTDPTTGDIYKCVGMTGKINVAAGSETVNLTPSTSIPAGKCSLQYCEMSVNTTSAANGVPGSLEECYPAQQYSPGANTPSGSPTSAVGAYCVTDNQSGTIGSDGVTCEASSGSTSPNTCTNGATDYPTCQACPSSQTMQGGTCEPTTTSGGGQVFNCDAADAPAACTGQQSPTDPNTYCYDNNQTCYPPAGQTMSGYTCNNVSGVETCTTTSPAQGPCLMGANGVCGPSTTTPPPSSPVTTKTGTTLGGNTGGNSSLNGLTSFLSGLAKGLTSPCTTQSSAGSTLVPEQVVQNGVVTTVYVQQPTTVGATQPCGTPLTAAQAPYGVGTNGVACSAPPAQPQCATNATPMPIYGMGNGCVTSYQCVPAPGSTISQTPTPQISCSPQIADVNESVAISYSCQNATGSSGGGFSTGNNLSGSASATVAAPPSGTNTANYGLTCTNNGQTASAQCSVQVNQPSIDLVANPQAVPSGEIASIGWVTAGMQSCVISSPSDATFTAANASDTNVNGTAQTDPITASTQYVLTCQTLGGETQTANTTVTVGTATATSTSLTVNSSVDGQSANHGDTVTITWQSSGIASSSAVSLWLIDVQSEEATALIAGDEPVNGTYQWQIPAVGSSCDSSNIAPCASDLVAGDSYGIEAAAYTPSGAYLGGTPEPANPVNPTYSGYAYTPNPFTIGQ